MRCPKQINHERITAQPRQWPATNRPPSNSQSRQRIGRRHRPGSRIPRGQLTNPPSGINQPRSRQRPGPNRGKQRVPTPPPQLRRRLDNHHQIRAGRPRRFPDLIGDGLHLQRIGDHHPGKTKLSAQQVGQYPSAERGRHSVQSRIDDMRRHQHVDTGVDRRTERQQVDLDQFRSRPSIHRKPDMTVHSG